MSNYLSLLGAFNKNRRPIDTAHAPLLEDVSTEQILRVRLATAKNAAGQDQQGFELLIADLGGVTYTTVMLTLTTGFTTIANFVTHLATLSTETPFTTYTNLKSIDYKVANTSGQSILLNDRFIVPGGRTYSTASNSTFVITKACNSLVKQKYEFAGNQTTAGNYTSYF